MRLEVAQFLVELNTAFYQQVASSFSATRTGAWAGWPEVMRVIVEDGVASHSERAKDFQGHLHILDAACGNNRFASFLQQEHPELVWRIDAFDNCCELADHALSDRIRFHQCNLIEGLFDGEASYNPFGALEPVDLAVSFGFLHHIPTQAFRMRYVKALIEATKPCGYIVLSLWRFLEDEYLAPKAYARKAQADLFLQERGIDPAELERGDALMGWQDSACWRYCHSFSQQEIDELVCALDAQVELKAQFMADGKSGKANIYCVFQKRESTR